MKDTSSKVKVDQYLLMSLSIAVHLFLFSFLGIREKFVDSQRYIGMADYVITHAGLESFYQVFYAIPIFLLAMFRILFDDGLAAFVLFQSLLSTVAAIFVYRSASKLFQHGRAGFIAAAIFLLWLDCIQWNTAIMTESIASSLICFTVYRLVVFKGTGRDFAILGALLTLSVMTRPTGVLSIIGVTFFLLSFYRAALKQRPAARAFVVAGLSLAFLFAARLMLNEWDFTDQYMKGNIITYMDVIQGQTHYHESLRVDTTGIALPDPGRSPAEKIIFFVGDNPLHFAKAAVLKVFYLVSFYRPYFSTLHNVYTALWLSLVYFLFYLGFRAADHKPIRSYCIAVIVANCLLVAVAAADWDNRFYLPMQPAIVLLAGGGGYYLLRRMSLEWTVEKDGRTTRPPGHGLQERN